MLNEVLAERTHAGHATGAGPRSGGALAEQTQIRQSSRRAAFAPSSALRHFGKIYKTTKRTNLLFLNELNGEDAISVLPRTLAEQTQRPAVGVMSGIGCCHFGRTNYPSFRPRNQRIAEGSAFWRNKPNAACRGRTAGRTGREAYGFRAHAAFKRRGAPAQPTERKPPRGGPEAMFARFPRRGRDRSSHSHGSGRCEIR